MTLIPPSQQASSVQARLSTATDDFIQAQLPDWLRRASRGQIRKLRDSFKRHQASHDRLRAATHELLPLQQFAERQFQALLGDALPPGTQVSDLHWVTVSPDFAGQLAWPDFVYKPKYTHSPALSKLMQGFAADSRFYVGSGLVLEGANDVLVAADDAFTERCRTLDAGKLYQDQVEQVYGGQNLNLLAEDKRSGFILAIEIAALRGEISALEQIALRDIATHIPHTVGQPVPHSVNHVELLGQTLSNALLVVLREFDGVIKSVLLYLPSAPDQALRRFTSLAQLHEQLVSELQRPGLRQCLSEQVHLEHRATFLQTLDLRLKDARPDLQLVRGSIVEDAFLTLARAQVQQVKDDARLLLVPTAEVDAAAAGRRIQRWESVGMGLVNLVGLFNPVVGALLLGQLVVQTLSDVFEGAVDWSKGHQHEALEHVLSVAEALAYTVATVAGVAVVRSAFVDALEPIALDTHRKRLWSGDLTPYETMPEDRRLQPDGLYGQGKRRWMRVQTRYYEVHRPDPLGPWRLRHPLRDSAYGPVVQHNGQRGWRLQQDQPLEWDDGARMLDCLWPQASPVDAERARQILQVAGMDVDELRGLLVESRPAPINLADTLRRFEVDARIEAFIGHLNSGALGQDEEDLLAWCTAQHEVAGPEQGMRERLIEQMPLMRWRLFESFAYAPRSSSSLALVVSRDFPGLPKGYIPQVLSGIDRSELEIALVQQRLSLAMASKARSLLRVARLTRALEGFYLGSASCAETDELAIALLRQLPGRPADLNLEVREATPTGRLLAELDPAGPKTGRISLVRVGRHFQLFDGRGQSWRPSRTAPTTIFEAIAAVLSSAQLQALGLGDDPADELRQLLITRLPNAHDRCIELLGWPAQPRWFNPGQRLPDGRVGYVLSGRGQGAAQGSSKQTLLNGLRQLFPGLDDDQLEQELQRLLHGEDMPFAGLAALQDDHVQLQQALNRWVSAELNTTRQASRQLLSDRVLRAWRGQGEQVPAADGQPGGLRLALSLGELASLPALPGQVQFNHVTSLAINDSSITAVPADFLHSFVNVNNLNLSGNRLLAIPTGLAHMTQLRTLRLARNFIRMTLSAFQALASLPQLMRLDLSYNPLGVLYVPFGQLQHLVQLNVRHCRLSLWPGYIELCQHLQLADLRDNQLAEVAPETLQMPQSFRQAFVVERNLLSNRQVIRLYALDTIPEAPQAGLSQDDIRALWIGILPESARSERGSTWDAVMGASGSGPFAQLMGQLQYVSDYAQARRYLATQVWSLLEELQQHASLRERMFEWVDEVPTVRNRVADVFTRLQVRMFEARAERAAVQGVQGRALIALGRGLYRLDVIALLSREATVRVNEQRAIARRADPSATHLADVDGRDIDLLYRVRLREALSLPGQPQTMHGDSLPGITEESIFSDRQRIERVGGIEELAEDLSQRRFWQSYLENRHANDFQVLESAHRARIGRYHAENPQATAAERARALDDLQIAHDAAVHRHRVALTRHELRSETARLG